MAQIFRCTNDTCAEQGVAKELVGEWDGRDVICGACGLVTTPDPETEAPES